MPVPPVSIIVVHYSSCEELRSCLASLIHLDYSNFSILVVDSNSPDLSPRYLEELVEPYRTAKVEISVVVTPTNAGYAFACNYGLANSPDCIEYYWLLNADVRAQRDSLGELIRVAEANPKLPLFASKVLLGDTDVIWSISGTVDYFRREVSMIGYGEEDRGQYDDLSRCDYVPGCAILLRSDRPPCLSSFSEDYFLYFEETDLCATAREKGLELGCVPSSVLRHYSADEKMQEPFYVYYYNRNALLFYYRHISLAAKVLLLLKVVVLEVPRNAFCLFRCPANGPKRTFRAHLMARLDFIFGRLGKRSYRFFF